MNILVLFPKVLFDTKVSPARRHSIFALQKIANVKISGVGWKDYNDNKTVNDNLDSIMPDADCVLWYKPLGQVNRFASLIKPELCKVPSVLRFNEAWWPDELAAKEVKETNSKIVIIHHEVDRPQFANVEAFIKHIPHCASKEFFFGIKPHSAREIDIILTGVLSKEIYPLRERFADLIKAGKIKGKIRKHPGYRKQNLQQCEEEVKSYAEDLGNSKIALVCSSKYKYPLAKYIEAAMSGCLVLGDLPEDPPPQFVNFIAPAHDSFSDKLLIETINTWLDDGYTREQTAVRGQKIAATKYSQENYAEEFIKTVKEYKSACPKV